MCFITGMLVKLLLAPAQGVILPEKYVCPQPFNEKKNIYHSQCMQKYYNIYIFIPVRVLHVVSLSNSVIRLSKCCTVEIALIMWVCCLCLILKYLSTSKLFYPLQCRSGKHLISMAFLPSQHM